MSLLEASKLFDCTGIVAVITGGGSGLGAFAARALDANGAKAVYILGRREASLKEVAASAKNGSVRTIVGDVTDKSSLAAAAAQVEREVGYVNVLFANSGIIGQGAASKLPKDYTLKQFQETLWSEADGQDAMSAFTNTLHVNVTGAYFTSLAFLHLLDEGNKQPAPGGAAGARLAPKSQIVTTASIAGLCRALGMGYDYHVSKAALIHMTKMMSTQLSRFNIRVNTIVPGFYVSEMTEKLPFYQNIFGDDKDPSKEGGVPVALSPLGRSGGEEDFAALVLYLFGPAGAFMNGNVFVSDGGRITTIPATY